jgi:hypothetical protein
MFIAFRNFVDNVYSKRLADETRPPNQVLLPNLMWCYFQAKHVTIINIRIKSHRHNLKM